jgi:lysosomal alpha-mannosidase
MSEVNYNHYEPPPGFCFDTTCNNDPIVSDTESINYNL